MTMPPETPPTPPAPQDADPAQIDPPKADPKPDSDFGNDVEKWKHFSRKNEADAKRAAADLARVQKELDDMKAAGMSDQEKAVAAAEAKGLAQAKAEFGEKLAAAAVLAAGAKESIDLSDEIEDLNLKRFIKDGDVDAEAVSAYVARQKARTPSRPSRKSAGELGVGPQNDNGSKHQITEDQLSKMSPEAIVKAQSEGRLNDLLGIK